MSERLAFLWIALVLAAIIVAVSFVFADEKGKPTSPQAMAAAALKLGAGAPAWRPLPAQNGLVVTAAKKFYYEPTIRDIILNDCSRCHSGAMRNLMDYDSLMGYVDSGMLAAMVQGPMAQFAGQDAETILAWIDAGTPEHAKTAEAPTAAALARPLPPSQAQRLVQSRPSAWRPLPQNADPGR